MFFGIKLGAKPIAYETMYYIVSYSLPFLRFRYTITDPIFTIGKWICSSTKLFQVLRVYNNIGKEPKPTLPSCSAPLNKVEGSF